MRRRLSFAAGRSSQEKKVFSVSIAAPPFQAPVSRENQSSPLSLLSSSVRCFSTNQSAGGGGEGGVGLTHAPLSHSLLNSTLPLDEKAAKKMRMMAMLEEAKARREAKARGETVGAYVGGIASATAFAAGSLTTSKVAAAPSFASSAYLSSSAATTAMPPRSSSSSSSPTTPLPPPPQSSRRVRLQIVTNPSSASSANNASSPAAAYVTAVSRNRDTGSPPPITPRRSSQARIKDVPTTTATSSLTSGDSPKRVIHANNDEVASISDAVVHKRPEGVVSSVAVHGSEVPKAAYISHSEVEVKEEDDKAISGSRNADTFLENENLNMREERSSVDGVSVVTGQNGDCSSVLREGSDNDDDVQPLVNHNAAECDESERGRSAGNTAMHSNTTRKEDKVAVDVEEVTLFLLNEHSFDTKKEEVSCGLHVDGSDDGSAECIEVKADFFARKHQEESAEQKGQKEEQMHHDPHASESERMTPVKEIDVFAKSRIQNYLKKWLTDNPNRVAWGCASEGETKRGGENSGGERDFDPFSEEEMVDDGRDGGGEGGHTIDITKEKFTPSYSFGDVSKAFITFKNAPLCAEEEEERISNNRHARRDKAGERNVGTTTTTTAYRTDVKVPVIRPNGSLMIIHGIGYASDEKSSQIAAAMHAERSLDEVGVQIFALPRMQQRYAEAARAQGRYAPMPKDKQRRDENISYPFPIVFDPKLRSGVEGVGAGGNNQKSPPLSRRDGVHYTDEGKPINPYGLRHNKILALRRKQFEQEERAAGGGEGGEYASHRGGVGGSSSSSSQSFSGTAAYKERMARERALREQQRFSIHYSCDPFGRDLGLGGVGLTGTNTAGTAQQQHQQGGGAAVAGVIGASSDLLKEIREGKLFVDLQDSGGGGGEEDDDLISNDSGSSKAQTRIGGDVKGREEFEGRRTENNTKGSVKGGEGEKDDEVLEITLEAEDGTEEVIVQSGEDGKTRDGSLDSRTASKTPQKAIGGLGAPALTNDGSKPRGVGGGRDERGAEGRLLSEGLIHGSSRSANRHTDKIRAINKIIDETEGGFFSIADEQEYVSLPLTTFTSFFYNQMAIVNVNNYLKSYYRIERATKLEEAEEELITEGLVSEGEWFFCSETMREAPALGSHGNCRRGGCAKALLQRAPTWKEKQAEEKALASSDSFYSFLIKSQTTFEETGPVTMSEKEAEMARRGEGLAAFSEGVVATASTTEAGEDQLLPSSTSSPGSNSSVVEGSDDSSSSPPPPSSFLSNSELLQRRLIYFDSLAEKLEMPPLPEFKDLVTITECEGLTTVYIDKETRQVTWYTATLVVPGIPQQTMDDRGAPPAGTHTIDDEQQMPTNESELVNSKYAYQSFHLDRSRKGGSSPHTSASRAVGDPFSTFFNNNPNYYSEAELRDLFPTRPTECPPWVAMGRASTREKALALCAVHAEFLIDAFGLPLYPEIDAHQRAHAEEAKAFGRWAVTPEEYHALHPKVISSEGSSLTKYSEVSDVPADSLFPPSTPPLLLIPTATRQVRSVGGATVANEADDADDHIALSSSSSSSLPTLTTASADVLPTIKSPLPRPIKEWIRILKRCGQKSRHRVSDPSRDELFFQTHRLFITRHRMHLMEFGLVRSLDDVKELAWCRALVLNFIRENTKRINDWGDTFGGAVEGGGGAAAAAVFEDRRPSFVNFRYGADRQIRTSILLPLPRQYGVRGGYAIGCSQQTAEGLASLHAIDTLCALCIPVSKDPAEQARLIAMRRAKGRIVPSGAPSDVHPLMRSPPGYRETIDTAAKPPLPSEVWRVMLLDAERFDYVKTADKSHPWLVSRVTTHPAFLPDVFASPTLSPSTSSPSSSSQPFAESMSNQAILSRFPRDFSAARQLPLMAILRQIIINYYLTRDVDDVGLHECDNYMTFAGKCSHYNGHQRRGSATSLAANNYWTEVPAPERFGRRMAWGRCVTRRNALEATMIHFIRTLFALGLYPNERPDFLTPHMTRRPFLRSSGSFPQQAVVVETQQTNDGGRAEEEEEREEVEERLPLAKSTQHEHQQPCRESNQSVSVVKGHTLVPFGHQTRSSVSYGVSNLTLFPGESVVADRELVVQYDALDVHRSLAARASVAAAAVSSTAAVPHAAGSLGAVKSSMAAAYIGGGGAGPTSSGSVSSSGSNLSSSPHHSEKVIDLPPMPKPHRPNPMPRNSQKNSRDNDTSGKNSVEGDRAPQLKPTSPLKDIRLFPSASSFRLSWEVSDWELWLSLPDGILADPRVPIQLRGESVGINKRYKGEHGRWSGAADREGAPTQDSAAVDGNSNTDNTSKNASCTLSASPASSETNNGKAERYESEHGVRVTYAEDFIEVGNSGNSDNISSSSSSSSSKSSVSGQDKEKLFDPLNPNTNGFKGYQGVYNGRVYLRDGTIVDENRFPAAWAIRIHRETLASMTGGRVPDNIPSPNPVSGSSNWECIFGRFASRGLK